MFFLLKLLYLLREVIKAGAEVLYFNLKVKLELSAAFYIFWKTIGPRE